ncbi:M23 family metallopeptidase [Actinacidiphila acidipaludis]|uniref:M23 family metallopeptidase n=1 Tax=Actinacidiphila acidipaludis TaxID=2873382 RepID=A0ABS7Q6C2_9ACTN|nr:M23 family metallopeptidase [Streptomyces acidipaludis]MBY8878696.1 M23 family metallopeptidase [Streptomyces acidipaludis]
MAFRVRPALRGKHRRRQPVRTAATLAGVAVIAGAGAFGASAMAGPDHHHAVATAAAKKNVLTQAASVTGSLANSFSAQADVQRTVANTAHEQADQARAEAAAEAKAKAAKAAAAAKAKAKAAAEAKAKAAAGAKAQARAAAAKAAAQAQSARATQAPVTAAPQAKAAADTGWTKPVDAAIGTPYHQAGSNWSSGYHTGVDFLVDSGTPVHSVAAGVVVSAGADGAYGNDVIIKHADGMYTLYGHLTEPLVSAGQTVTEGQEIGISGATGNVTGPHLHFEVRTTPDYGSDVDPIAYLAKHGVTV